jgi:hypothetical protein
VSLVCVFAVILLCTLKQILIMHLFFLTQCTTALLCLHKKK